ncbi:MAG: hypothetical protein CMH52_12075 [Myxococcales bacterium]|nr:hypothetical protein [Myxococcales bacterium]
MTEQIFRFHGGRLVRNFVSLVPLAAFPVALHHLGKDDPALIVFFSVIAIGFTIGVVFTAMRFRMSVNANGILCRGRFKTRTVRFDDVTAAFVRQGRDKASRFMGPPPFRELVLKSGDTKFVISSLPLGPDAFDELLSILAQRLPDDVLDVRVS